MGSTKRKKPAMRVVEKVTPIRPETPAVWTGLQLLEEFVAAVKAAKTTPDKLMIFWLEATPDGRLLPRRWQSGCERADEIALCEMAKLLAMEDWKA